MTEVLIALLVLNALMLIAVWALYRKSRKARGERRVEDPNSEYRSQHVRDLEAQERWEALDLERLHPLNRQEVAAVLDKLRNTSVRALDRTEREFLERMVEAETRARGGGSGKLMRGNGDPRTAGA